MENNSRRMENRFPLPRKGPFPGPGFDGAFFEFVHGDLELRCRNPEDILRHLFEIGGDPGEKPDDGIPLFSSRMEKSGVQLDHSLGKRALRFGTPQPEFLEGFMGTPVIGAMVEVDSPNKAIRIGRVPRVLLSGIFSPHL